MWRRGHAFGAGQFSVSAVCLFARGRVRRASSACSAKKQIRVVVFAVFGEAELSIII